MNFNANLLSKILFFAIVLQAPPGRLQAKTHQCLKEFQETHGEEYQLLVAISEHSSRYLKSRESCKTYLSFLRGKLGEQVGSDCKRLAHVFDRNAKRIQSELNSCKRDSGEKGISLYDDICAGVIEEASGGLACGRPPSVARNDAIERLAAIGKEIEAKGLFEIKDNTVSFGCFGQSDLNFGALVYNKNFKIYRSTGLGTLGLRAYRTHLEGSGLECPTRVIYMNRYGYRDNSFKPKAIKGRIIMQVKKTYSNYVQRKTGKVAYHTGNFATEQVLAAQNPGEKCSLPVSDENPVADPDIVDVGSSSSEFERASESAGFFPFDFIHPQSSNVLLGGVQPFTEGGKKQKIQGREDPLDGGRSAFYEVLNHILTNEGPVSFHCKGGIHRTGMTALMIRYLQGDAWTRPIEPPLHRDASRDRKRIPEGVELKNLAEYEYWKHNPKNFRKENLEAIRMLAADGRFKCLADRFSCLLNQKSEKPVVETCESPVSQEKQNEDCVFTSKDDLWKACESLAPETDVANHLDELESLVNKRSKKSSTENRTLDRLFGELPGKIDAYSARKVEQQEYFHPSDLKSRFCKISTRLNVRGIKIEGSGQTIKEYCGR